MVRKWAVSRLPFGVCGTNIPTAEASTCEAGDSVCVCVRERERDRDRERERERERERDWVAEP